MAVMCGGVPGAGDDVPVVEETDGPDGLRGVRQRLYGVRLSAAAVPHPQAPVLADRREQAAVAGHRHVVHVVLVSAERAEARRAVDAPLTHRRVIGARQEVGRGEDG